VDGLTWRTYEADLDQNLTDLASRVHRGAYRRCRRAGRTYQRPTEDSARWRWPPLKTKLSRGRLSRC
jgi:hypothetical protein